MDSKKTTVSKLLSRRRGWVQAGATVVTNIHLPNFIDGSLYKGAGKSVCVPGLNCYSCPAATGACPIGAFQSVVGNSKFSFSYYVTGTLILLGVLLGRFICGFLCPFGWFQDLLHKIPSKKISTTKLKPLRLLKYAVLLFSVVLLPALLVNDVGLGEPIFCKYICPQGVLEGAIPLSIVDSGIRATLGLLFEWKFTILVVLILLSVFIYRPFCKWICPLGAIYGLMNRVSMTQMNVDKNKCVSCGKCARACKMDVDVTKTPNHFECIRCGMCVTACPTDAVSIRFGLGDAKTPSTKVPGQKIKHKNAIDNAVDKGARA
ncbi:4Fe-4S binding protein [Phoenicibacter congonensis]|uniref:4Fe-4S binding protein n=1 Tax=Phoenicibacter congonensis TaxID=1944646 RepID=UPI0009A78B11|nr:4Fe-4S binding protein [Phoenicibacter congonensis]